MAAKRLRYTIEVFKVLFDDELRADIQTMKGVQDLLGEMHDCDVWTETLPDVTKDIMTATSDEGLIGPGVNALITDRSKVREEKYTEFVVAWSELRRRRFFENIENRFQTELMVKDASRSFFDSLNKSKRLAIISDVHGNLDALQAVMKDAKEKGVSAFLNAGDIVGSGAYPEEVVSLIKGSTMVSVSGNFDFKVLEFARASQRPRSRSIKRAIVAAAARDLSDDSLEFLSSLPMEQRL